VAFLLSCLAAKGESSEKVCLVNRGVCLVNRGVRQVPCACGIQWYAKSMRK